MVEYLTLLKERPDNVINKAIKETIADAEVLWSPIEFEGYYPRGSGFGIAPLRPKDLGITGTTDRWEVTISSVSSATTYIDHTLDEDVYVVLEGIQDLTSFYTANKPVITAFQITASGDKLPVINLTEAFANDENIRRYYFKEPLIIKPKSGIKVDVYAPSTGTDYFGFIGTTVAKRAYLIQY